MARYIDGYHHDNMLMLYCCGKFHLLLVAEASLDKRARMTTKALNVFVFQRDVPKGPPVRTRGLLGQWLSLCVYI